METTLASMFRCNENGRQFCDFVETPVVFVFVFVCVCLHAFELANMVFDFILQRPPKRKI